MFHYVWKELKESQSPVKSRVLFTSSWIDGYCINFKLEYLLWYWARGTRPYDEPTLKLKVNRALKADSQSLPICDAAIGIIIEFATEFFRVGVECLLRFFRINFKAESGFCR